MNDKYKPVIKFIDFLYGNIRFPQYRELNEDEEQISTIFCNRYPNLLFFTLNEISEDMLFCPLLL